MNKKRLSIRGFNSGIKVRSYDVYLNDTSIAAMIKKEMIDQFGEGEFRANVTIIIDEVPSTLNITCEGAVEKVEEEIEDVDGN